jgi:hypothetical protein
MFGRVFQAVCSGQADQHEEVIQAEKILPYRRRPLRVEF